MPNRAQRSRVLSTLAAILPLLGWVGPAGAQATITGTIVDRESGAALEGAAILVSASASTVITGPDGRFTFRDLPVGEYIMRFQLIGYAERLETLKVLRPGSIDLRVDLTRSPFELDAINVEGVASPFLTRVGFYDRKEAGYSGTFIDRATIAKRDPKLFTDLFRSVSGAIVRSQGMGRNLIRFNRSVGGARGDHPDGCVPDLYVDGLVTGGRPGYPRLEDHDIVDPFHVEAVEVYVGAAGPIQYRSECGVILVWTRHR